MNEEFYIIETKDIKMFLSPNCKNGNINFDLEYFILKNDKEHMFCVQNSTHNCPYLENRKLVHLREYIFNIYKEIADKQLTEFIESNIDNYDFYLNKIGRSIITFPNINILDNIEKRIEYDFLHININFDKFINNGTIELKFDNIYCYYNLISQKHICFKEDSKNIDISPLYLIYRGDEYKLLVFEQYKIGKAPHAYIELIELNRFLKNKASVKLVMKDNKIYTYKSSSSNLTASYLISFSSDNTGNPLEFELIGRYFLTPKPQKDITLEDLDYLQYRQFKHKINLNTEYDFKPIN